MGVIPCRAVFMIGKELPQIIERRMRRPHSDSRIDAFRVRRLEGGVREREVSGLP